MGLERGARGAGRGAAASVRGSGWVGVGWVR